MVKVVDIIIALCKFSNLDTTLNMNQKSLNVVYD